MTAPVVPAYKVFFVDVYSTLFTSWEKLNSYNKTPQSWLSSVRKFCFVTTREICLVLLLAVLWTVLRMVLSKNVFKPCAFYMKLPPKEAKKSPESAWKLLFYLTTWSYSVYLLFFANYTFFHDAPSAFEGWTVGMDVPTDIYIAYMVQMSFYLHSVYATLYLDVWRKDSVVMLAHHGVTSLLIGFSFAFRYVNIGLLVLFCHDITDIVLESTKLILYCKTKGGRWYPICDFLSTIGFLLFGITWYVFRLYWYPLKAMYAAGHTSQISIDGGPPFYFFFNALLWILLGMNIYWFSYIVFFAYKVVTGQASEVDDVRDYEEENNHKTSNGVGPIKKKK